MTDKTTQECIYRAMTELGRLYAGEAPSAEDYASVEALHEPLIAQLSAEDIYYIGDPDAVAPEIFLPYCRLLAIAASGSFGAEATATLIGRASAENVNSLETRERQTLRRIASTRPTRAVLGTEYF